MKNFKILSVLAVSALTLFPAQNVWAWGQFDGGHHPDHNPHLVRRDPVIVHRTYVAGGGGGCVGCGVAAAAVAGLVGGAIIGSAIAGGAGAPPPTTIVEQAPPPPQVIVEQAPPPPQVLMQAYPPGTAVAGLPLGCASMNVNGVNYFQCGPTWYQPFMGGNGVYYVVVPTP
jgi:hypothetical protein